MQYKFGTKCELQMKQNLKIELELERSTERLLGLQWFELQIP